METPRNVLRTLFRDTAFPLVQHHLDSFNALLDTGIPTLIKSENPFELELSDKRYIRVYIGGKDGTKVVYSPPTDDIGNAIVPHACRLDNQTYAMNIDADIEIDYVFPDGKTETQKFESIRIGQIPIMLRSKMCYLTQMNGYDIGECKFEQGGYFIIDGSEKVLLTQELLGNNMFYTGTRKRKSAEVSGESEEEKKARRERESELKVPFMAKFDETNETFVGIKSISEDGSRGPYSHFLVVPAAAAYAMSEEDPNWGRDRRVAVITLPGFTEPVPVLSIFRALGIVTDKDLYDTVLAGVADKDRIAYDDIFRQLILSHDTYLKRTRNKTDMELLELATRRKYKSEVIENLYEKLFPHIEGGDQDPGTMFRRKGYMLGQMLKMGIDVALERVPPSDRDNIMFKRLNTSGDLCFQEFRRIYREVGKSMQLDMDKRVQYERKTYEGRLLKNLVVRETIGKYWKPYRLLNEFSKSFKGMWGKRAGISQELSRLSYIGTLSHMRRTNLQIDPSMNTAPPRRLYASQFGLTCPVDSPDGSSIGHTKALTILARVSNAFPSSIVKNLLVTSPTFRKLADIHPSTWQPKWTPIFVNSDLVGVNLQDTEALHVLLRDARRAGTIHHEVSLAWDRLGNVYRIECGAGRPIRPVYRENANADIVRNAKTWAEIAGQLDYIDAPETAVSRLSITPFHPTDRSEIHMSFNMSAIANLVPFSDHNPGTRNVFSIAQQKQAASWYHTNYTKRFDTIAMFLANPQMPMSQTWMYREVMGAGGCLPYGENALVAITTYNGHNQEDSVMLNQSSLKRGMFRTMYYHSYDASEEMIDPTTQLHTEIANPILNPLFRDSVKRKDGMNYEMLDADGYIKVNSIVDDTTILVGMVRPTTSSAAGTITGYRDISMTPKRGQHGRIDAVYRYNTPDGIKGVKIRIVEERSPVPGDKMASRHSQKGTCGMLMSEEDMPFTSRGVRPDIIFNPHALPTRMTVGQFLESSCSRLGLDLGTFVDATPFTVSNRINDLKESMIARGFEPYGSEILYNGLTGEMMEADIFMGPVYYQRLKHMVEDKINYRATGPKTLMTHQPVKGRSNEGGMALGSMERDALLAHGVSKFFHESFMERSDKAELQFDREAQRFDTSRETLTVPYALGVYMRELESTHVAVHIQTA
jgi:DNA-directed RNA polymerase II subunit RPB2